MDTSKDNESELHEDAVQKATDLVCADLEQLIVDLESRDDELSKDIAAQMRALSGDSRVEAERRVREKFAGRLAEVGHVFNIEIEC